MFFWHIDVGNLNFTRIVIQDKKKIRGSLCLPNTQFLESTENPTRTPWWPSDSTSGISTSSLLTSYNTHTHATHITTKQNPSNWEKWTGNHLWNINMRPSADNSNMLLTYHKTTLKNDPGNSANCHQDHDLYYCAVQWTWYSHEQALGLQG